MDNREQQNKSAPNKIAADYSKSHPTHALPRSLSSSSLPPRPARHREGSHVFSSNRDPWLHPGDLVTFMNGKLYAVIGTSLETEYTFRVVLLGGDEGHIYESPVSMREDHSSYKKVRS